VTNQRRWEVFFKVSGRYLLVLSVFFLAGIFFGGFFFGVTVTGLWYQQNQKARERASEANRTGEKEDTIQKNKNTINLFFNFEKKVALTKRTGEKEDTIKKRKKIQQIYFLISRKKLRSPPTTTSYYR